MAGDVLEVLNVIAADQPLILIGDPRNLDMIGSAMLALAASPTLEVRQRLGAYFPPLVCLKGAQTALPRAFFGAGVVWPQEVDVGFDRVRRHARTSQRTRDAGDGTIFPCSLLNTCQDSTRELSLEVITGLCESAPSELREGGGRILGDVLPLTVNVLARHPEGIRLTVTMLSRQFDRYVAVSTAITQSVDVIARLPGPFLAFLGPFIAFWARFSPSGPVSRLF